jgi:hypothetical protein
MRSTGKHPEQQLAAYCQNRVLFSFHSIHDCVRCRMAGGPGGGGAHALIT